MKKGTYIYYGEKVLGLKELSKRGAKLKSGTIKARLHKGWSVERAVDEPLFVPPTSVTRTREYSCWRSMKRRILNENNHNYPMYGGSGLEIEPEWIESFDAFMSHIGKMPEPKSKYSIDRIENSKGYIKGNVRWATSQSQSRNRKSNRYETFRGKRRLLIELAEEFGIHYGTLISRLTVQGWDIDKALTTPVRKRDRLFVFMGKNMSLIEIATKTGHSYELLNNRVTKLGMTIDEAVSKSAEPEKLLIHGEWLTRNQITKKYHISRLTLKKRLENGMTPEQAVSDQTERKLYQGEMLSRKELSIRTGISLDTISRRWHNGLCIEEIVKPQSRILTKFPYEGEMLTVSKIAERAGLSYDNLRQLMSEGKSIEVILAELRKFKN